MYKHHTHKHAQDILYAQVDVYLVLIEQPLCLVPHNHASSLTCVLPCAHAHTHTEADTNAHMNTWADSKPDYDPCYEIKCFYCCEVLFL